MNEWEEHQYCVSENGRKFNFVDVKTEVLSDITDECFNTDRAVSAQN